MTDVTKIRPRYQLPLVSDWKPLTSNWAGSLQDVSKLQQFQHLGKITSAPDDGGRFVLRLWSWLRQAAWFLPLFSRNNGDSFEIVVGDVCAGGWEDVMQWFDYS